MPADIKAAVAGYAWEALGEGRSAAAVYRLRAPGKPVLFLKVDDCSELSDELGEAARLRWLQALAMPAPSVIAEARSAQHSWLLMSEVPGLSLARDAALKAEQFVSVYAEALRKLHSVDVRACTFVRTLDQRLSEARRRVEKGLVAEEDFDDERRGRTARELYEELIRSRPRTEDLVVCHGDATADNLLASKGRFSGFVDCGGLGFADRYQDLALACREIGERFGPSWIKRFFDGYGATPDRSQIRFYRLLDEFF